MKTLTQQTLVTLLQERFTHDTIRTLSQFPDPFTLKGMNTACERIAKAIAQKEKITVVGDYDVDGVVAGAIMRTFFEAIEYPVTIILPNRFRDGYGLGESILDRIDTSVIITVDNGIAAHSAAKLCLERGIDLIITDHHTPKETLPEALSIINPKQEDCPFVFTELAGAGVAWYLCVGLKKTLGLTFELQSLFDFVMVATIADSVPLRDMNRLLCKAGLGVLAQKKRPCWEALEQVLGKWPLTFDDIAFAIAPRINSAGRLDDASTALEFLCAKTREEALQYLAQLDSYNAMRKAIEKAIFDEAVACVNSHDSVIVVHGKEWHEGVIGIVASRLVDLFNRPAIVLAGNEEIVKGSARSIEGIDILAILNNHTDFLVRFGGHKAAAGLSLKQSDVELFRQHLNKSLTLTPSKGNGKILGLLPLCECNFELLDLLEQFEPYGEGNPRPLFRSRAIVNEAKLIGQLAQTLKIRLYDNNVVYEGIKFRTDITVECGKEITFDFLPSRNRFRNTETLQLMIENFGE